jgi:DnaJ-class molecular chaperone with C-terminal Zn finger domain
MNKHIDFYKILQVHHDAGQDIIDAAYRCLSKIYHPDINKSPMAVERMKDINIAYSVIGDSRKRQEYHLEWMRQNAAKPLTSVMPNREKPNPEPDPVKEAKKEEEAATRALDEFFCETVNERWEKAYQKLTKIDTENIPQDDFLEWKKAVAQVYKLGNYKITYFRRYTNCDYAGVVFPTIFQFSVGLTEMQISTGRISEENTQKYVAYDGTSWRVCLGYTDLKPTIMKFKYLALALPKLDKDEVFMKAITKTDLLTGLLSLSGFVEQAEREMLRSQRYGNPLSLAVITIEPVSDLEDNPDENQFDACISYVSEILCANVRKTDILSRCNPSSFSILFTETKPEDAVVALNKLLELCDAEGYLNYDIYSACVPVYKGNMEQIIQTTLEKTVLREKSGNYDEESEYMRAKLGKYKLSDILGFNKKGKNHF